jgi:hypothetical protein
MLAVGCGAAGGIARIRSVWPVTARPFSREYGLGTSQQHSPISRARHTISESACTVGRRSTTPAHVRGVSRGPVLRSVRRGSDCSLWFQHPLGLRRREGLDPHERGRRKLEIVLGLTALARRPALRPARSSSAVAAHVNSCRFADKTCLVGQAVPPVNGTSTYKPCTTRWNASLNPSIPLS